VVALVCVILASCLLGTIVGARILMRSRGAAAGAERWMGLALLFVWAGGFPLFVVAAAAPSEVPRFAAIALATVCGHSGVACIFLFTRRVYRPEVGWIRAALAVPFLALVVATAGMIAASWETRASLEAMLAASRTWSFLSNNVANAAFLWTAAESFRWWRLLRKRVPLGLADPLVANRFLLWGLFASGTAAGNVVNMVLVLSGLDRLEGSPTFLATTVVTMLSIVPLWLAFMPPEAWVRFLRRSAPSLLGAATFAILTSLASPALATLLAYEPFLVGPTPADGEYVAGDEVLGIGVLGGQNPVIGPTDFYAGPWIQSGGDTQVVKDLPSLSHPSLAEGIGGIQEETIQFSCCTFGRTGRALSGGGLGGGPLTISLYESFLIDFGNQGTDDVTQFGLRGHELWNGGIGDTFRTVFLFVNSFEPINTLTLRVDTASGTQTVPVGGGMLDLAALAATNGGTHLVVMKYDFRPSDPDVVSVYLDPADVTQPGTPDAQISIAASDLFITHQGAFSNFTFSGSGHVPGAIDEIRWGTSFGDVMPTPAPEPAQAMLVAVGAASLLSARLRSGRRRQGSV
jgi:hypothetical protein